MSPQRENAKSTKNHKGDSLVVNREHWLTLCAKGAELFFQGYKIPKYKITCSWPSQNALGVRRRRVGECHNPQLSVGGIYEIFISPLLSDPMEVAGTVVHELAHAIAGTEAGHGPDYAKVCRAIGLTKGKPTCAMPGPVLESRIKKVIAPLGEYPHPGMKLPEKERKPKKSLTLECASCGCKISMTLKWFLESGAPTCACSTEFSVATPRTGEEGSKARG